MKKKNTISAEQFDKMFDNGEDVSAYMDSSKGYRLSDLKRVNVDFPVWMIEKLDREATKLGLARQALIKFFVAEKLGYNAAGN